MPYTDVMTYCNNSQLLEKKIIASLTGNNAKLTAFFLLILVCKVAAMSLTWWPAVVNKATMFNVKVAVIF